MDIESSEYIMLDPIQIGERIRTIRKQKNIVLEELTDIFSIGKLSNIEKGKVAVTLDDIKKICERLNVPIEDVIDTPSINESSRVISDLKRIRYLLSLNNLKMARGLMKETKINIRELGIKYLLSEIYFYYGVYMLRQKNLKFARVFLKKVVEDKAEHEHTKNFQIRAYNALTYIEYGSGKISLAWQCTKKAKEIIDTCSNRLIDDEAIVYFNSSIIALYIGDYHLASRNAQTALNQAEGSFSQLILFVLSIIQLLNREFGPAKINLDMCIEYFSREEETENLSRAALMQYYMYRTFSGQYKNESPIVEDDIFEGLIEKVKNDDHVNRTVLSIIQTFLAVAINGQQYDFAKRILKELNEYQRKSPNFIQNYKTYYLEARLVRETNSDFVLEKSLLERSLSLVDDTDFLEKAMILHELNNIDGIKEGILYESNSIFYDLLKLGMENFRILKHLLPPLRY